jgi:hypothetical protein
MRKLTARNHVHTPPHRKVVPTESHSDGQNAGYFLRSLQTVLLALGIERLLHGTSRLLRGNSYLWHVNVVMYNRPTTDCIHRIRQVIEASTSRWTLDGGMREAAQEALAIL